MRWIRIVVFCGTMALGALAAQATDRLKANNNENLDLSTSWSSGTPGTGDLAVWDSTVEAANCTNNLNAAKTWGGIRILDPGAPVKLASASGSTLSLNSSGIDLNQSASAQDLWLALPLTAAQAQSWSVKPGRMLTLGETNASVTLNANVTLNGQVRFVSAINVQNGASLTIADEATLEPTLTVPGAVIQVGSSASGGAVNQTGGVVKLHRTDGSAGSPKGSLLVAASGAGVYSISGGSLLDTTPANASTVIIGSGSASGTLNVSGTALVQVVGMRLANASAATGTLNLSNACSVSVAGGSFDVGRSTSSPYTSAAVNVYGGTLTSATGMNVPHGYGPGSLNIFGGTVVLNGTLAVPQAGSSGNGTVTLHGGSLTVSNGVLGLPDGGSGTGTFNLNGGTLVVSQISRGSGAANPATLVLNGGRLTPTANHAAFIGATVTVTVATNGACIDTAGFKLTIPAPLLHGSGASVDGGLVKLGPGTLTLTASNSYSGLTVVSNGTLQVNNLAGSGTGSGNLIVRSGATLSGTGAIGGVVTIDPGGTLAPGAPSGALTLSNPPVLQGNLKLEISKLGSVLGGGKLALAGGGTVNFGGTLTVTASGDPLAPGDTFNLFDAPAFAGTFSATNLPALPADWCWDLSRLKTDGSIRVAGTSSVPQPSFTAAQFQSPDSLVLTGTGGLANGTFYLLSSTNLALPLSTWTLIATSRFDAEGKFSLSCALNSKLAAQYFALSLSPPVLSLRQSEILAMLTNLRDNGFNGLPSINGGLGGLWVNWRYGTSPLLVNWNGSGQPDGPEVDPPRHDALTDLRYLHNLLSYKSRYPVDTQFDAEIRRYTAIVQSEFNASRNERGWILDEQFLPLWWLSGDGFFLAQALNQAAYFANQLFHTNINAYYKTSSTHTNGYFRADWQVEIGCSLIQAGTLFSNADWTLKGQQMLQFAYDHAYLTNYHLFLVQMDNVLLPDGSANPNPAIYRDGSTDGGHVRFGAIGQEILSLLHTYQVTTNPYYLNRAVEMLDGLTVEANRLGLWDTSYGGYFGGLAFPGPDLLHPGTPSLIKGTKECGRQMAMLQAFHVANALTGNRYASTESTLLQVALQKAYYAPGHGVLYEALNDWTPRINNGTPGDWVTTEAMGILLEAFFSLDEAQPW